MGALRDRRRRAWRLAGAGCRGKATHGNEAHTLVTLLSETLAGGPTSLATVLFEGDDSAPTSRE
jgi:hypothetical protein